MIDGRMCAKHRAGIAAWQGTLCGAGGWGPGHRIPKFDTSRPSVQVMDEQVRMIRGWCMDNRGCSDELEPEKRCASPDHRDYN